MARRFSKYRFRYGCFNAPREYPPMEVGMKEVLKGIGGADSLGIVLALMPRGLAAGASSFFLRRSRRYVP